MSRQTKIKINKKHNDNNIICQFALQELCSSDCRQLLSQVQLCIGGGGYNLEKITVVYITARFYCDRWWVGDAMKCSLLVCRPSGHQSTAIYRRTNQTTISKAWETLT